MILKKMRLILGKSGAGKSTYIAEEIKKIAPVINSFDTKDKIYILVPDQYTMTSERFYIDRIGEDIMSKVSIMSFKRFATMVFSKVGGLAFEFIGDGGRRALMAKAVEESSIFFKHYPEGYYNIKFVDMLTETIREIKAARITPEELLEISQNEKNNKLHDIAVVYSGFEGLLAGGYFDPDDNFTRLGNIVEEQQLFKDTHIYIDNFKTFNTKEYGVIKSLFINGSKLSIALQTDRIQIQERWETLAKITETADDLYALASRYGGHCEHIILAENKRFLNTELAYLTNNLFNDSVGTYNGVPQNIFLYKGNDLFDEIEFVAAEISALVRDKGYKYSDFVICARDIDAYTGFIEPVFDEYGIPAFYHKKSPLRQKAPAMLILSLLSIIIDGYNEDNVLDCLKTGFFEFDYGDIALFEAYISKWRVRGNRFLQPFTMRVRGFDDDREEKDEDKKRLETINLIRKSFTSKIERLKKEIKDATVSEISEGIYKFLEGIDIEGSLKAMSEVYARYEEQALYAEQEQVYDLIIGALDELVLVCGTDTITLDRYRDLFAAIIDAHDIAIIPTSVDEVMTGNVDKLPLMSPRCVFVLGMADGVFPKKVEEDILITDDEKNTLANYNIQLGMTAEEKLLYERFLCLVAFSAPREKLYVSYSAQNGNLQSPFFSEIIRLFNNVEIRYSPLRGESEDIDARVQNEASAFALYSRLKLPVLKDYFDNTDYISYMTEPERRDFLSGEVSAELFGRHMRISATKADRFHKCRFSYFFEYGMNLKADRRTELDALAVGNFMHGALEDLLPKTLTGKIDMDRDIANYGKRYKNQIFKEEQPSAAFEEYLTQLMRKVFRLLGSFVEEQEQSDFKPEEYELKIDEYSKYKPLQIPFEGGDITFTGKVDRMDVYAAPDGKSYVRIIDYKTGSKTFDLKDIYNGLDIQMPIYLYSLVRNTENAEPGGVMYVNIKPTIKKIKRTETEEFEKASLSEIKQRSGLFLNSPDVLQAMDKALEGKYIPVKKTGKKNPVATTKEFNLLFGHIKNMLSEMGKSLLEGRIEKNPILNDDRSCEYCDYKAYCEREGRGRKMETIYNVFEKIEENIEKNNK